MKTTVELPDLLFKQVKARAAMEGIKLKDYIAGALEQRVMKPSGASRGARMDHPPFRLPGHRKPIPAYTNAEMEERLIAESSH